MRKERKEIVYLEGFQSQGKASKEDKEACDYRLERKKRMFEHSGEGSA